jgi:hypothetical protein
MTPITHRESWRFPVWLGLGGRYDAVNTVKELMADRGRCFGSSGWTRRSLLLLTSFGSGYVAGAYLRWLVPSRA